MRLRTIITILALIVISAFSGCKSQPPPPPAKAVKPQEQASPAVQPEATQAQAVETAQAEGYVYQPRDRRDPFVPLIATTKKSQRKGSAGRTGTLESYDISEFALLAVAQKGDKSFALLATPDNRSFTVHKGTVIGFNKGMVEEISKNKVVIVEYSKDYKGDIHPKQITLELSKER